MALLFLMRPGAEIEAPVSKTETIQVVRAMRHVEVPSRCMELGPIAPQEIKAARQMLEELSLTDRISRVDSAAAVQWWVNIPPLPSRAEVLKRARELEKLGVKDVRVLGDDGPSKHALSLGLFRSEAAALARMADLVKRGIKGARVDRQEQVLTQTAFYATDPDADTIAKLTQVKAQFGNAELRQVSCPALKKSAN